MEPQKPISHLVAGLIIGAIMVIFFLILQFTGLGQTPGVQWVGYVILISGLVIFINMYSKTMNGRVTFGNLFGYGFKITAVLTLIVIFFTVCFFLLFPDIKEKIFEITRQKMEERNTPDDQIEKGLALWRKMFWVFTIGGTLLLYAIIGAIGSLLGAAITKKKPINPVDQLDM
jgi:NADH:ubiquinone oxidoreductase subunit 6 (subunit J)